LESLLQDSQEKLTAANHRYVMDWSEIPGLHTLILFHRFEAQLTAVKERLEAAKAGSTRGLGSPGAGPGGFSFGGVAGRIAKPLRGGGGGGEVTVPTISGLQSENSGSNKRSSGFFSWQK
jgi:kinesin family protein 5